MAIGVVGVVRPVPVVVAPLVPAGPGGLHRWAPVVGSAQGLGKLPPADHHVWPLRAPLGHAQFPAERRLSVGLGGNFDMVEVPTLGSQPDRGAGVAVHLDFGDILRPAVQLECAKRGFGGIDPDIPHIRLVVGILEEPERAGLVVVGGFAHRRTSVLAISPAARHKVAADRDLGVGHLVGKLQQPAELPQLLGNVRDGEKAPPRPVGIVVHRAAAEIDLGDDRLAIAEVEAEGRIAVDRHIEIAIRKRRWNNDGAVADRGAGDFRKGVVVEPVGHLAVANGEVGIGSPHRIDRYFPGDLFRRHRHAVGLEQKAVGRLVRQRVVVACIDDFLLPGIEAERFAGQPFHRNVVGGGVAGIEIGRHQQALAGEAAVEVSGIARYGL